MTIPAPPSKFMVGDTVSIRINGRRQRGRIVRGYYYYDELPPSWIYYITYNTPQRGKYTVPRYEKDMWKK